MKKQVSIGRKILLVSGVLIILALAAGAYWLFFMRGIVYSDDARIGGDLVDLAPQVSGVLSKVLVREGDKVLKGQALFVLNDQLLQASLAKARGALGSARARLALAQARYARALNGPVPQEIKVAEAATERLRAEENLTLIELTRIKTLYNRKATSLSQLNRAESSSDAARQALEEALHKLKLLQNGTRPEDVRAAMAEVALAKGQMKEAEASLSKAGIRLGYAMIRAPFDGVIVRRWRDPGAMLPEGTPVLTLLNMATLRVDANIEEKYLHEIAEGDPVDIAVDAFPGLHMKGRVIGIMRAANSEFSLIPAQGVAGTYIKVTQRVALRIAIVGPVNRPIGPGLSAEVHIHVHPARPVE
ncbi:MAG: HlyD family secretion protein [Desulfatiglandaceae bacterium]